MTLAKDAPKSLVINKLKKVFLFILSTQTDARQKENKPNEYALLADRSAH